MESSNELILDVWEVVRGYCNAKKRDELAHRLLHIFEDHGADSKFYTQLLGEDFNLDNAINEWTEEHEEDLGDDDFEEYFEEDEEE